MCKKVNDDYLFSQWWTEKSSCNIFPMREIHFSDHARTNFSAEFTRRRKSVSKCSEKLISQIGKMLQLLLGPPLRMQFCSTESQITRFFAF
jgi:hypothetical protein